jgi:hypothetical protein
VSMLCSPVMLSEVGAYETTSRNIPVQPVVQCRYGEFYRGCIECPVFKEERASRKSPESAFSALASSGCFDSETRLSARLSAQHDTVCGHRIRETDMYACGQASEPSALFWLIANC